MGELMLGINTPTNSLANIDLLKASGSTIVRQVATGHPDLGNWITAYRNAGQEVLLVLANESRDTCPDQDWVQWYASRYAGDILAVSCGNEPDGQHGGSSAVATHEEIDALIEQAADAFLPINVACKLIGPGLISGQPQWLDGLTRLNDLDAIAVHAYWKPAAELRGFLDGYRQHAPGKPIWLTEFDLRPDLVRAAAEIPYVEAIIPYCWRAWPGWPHTLVDEQERPLPLYGEFQMLAQELKVAKPEFLFGFADYAKQHPEVGAPLSSERYFAVDLSVQLAEGGLLVYSKEANAVRFMPAQK